MSQLTDLIKDAGRIAIIGHIRPDGDDVGSCLGLYNYICDNYPAIRERVKVFLEEPGSKFNFLAGYDSINHKVNAEDKDFDLVICLDCATRDRLGEFGKILGTAGHSICIDHHKTNPGYCEFNDIRPAASSTCEVLYELIDDALIRPDTATCIYTGIVHDTGVFQYTNTSKRTMEIGGRLLEKGVNSEDIISGSFFEKTYDQIRAWGYAFQNAVLTDHGKCIYAIFTWKDMKKFGITSKELDGISAELRNVRGVLFAMLIYQDGENTYKLSMRSTGNVDCSLVAVKHQGGGHVHASGCTCEGDPQVIADTLLSEIREQL